MIAAPVAHLNSDAFACWASLGCLIAYALERRRAAKKLVRECELLCRAVAGVG